MTGNVGRFAADIAAALERAGDKRDAFVRQFCQELTERVIERTPVDTGYARASWQVSLDGIPEKFPLKGDGSDNTGKPGSPMPTADFSFVFPTITGDVTFTLASNCVYMLRLEYGHSAKAPDGMVRRTLAEASVVVREVLQMLGKA